MAETNYNKTIFDGIEYAEGATLPDLGSLVNKGTDTDREYWGLSADMSKLPTVATYPQYKGHLHTGDLFIAADASTYRVYEASTDSWKERA